VCYLSCVLSVLHVYPWKGQCSTTESAARQSGDCSTQKKMNDGKGHVRVDPPPFPNLMNDHLLFLTSVSVLNCTVSTQEFPRRKIWMRPSESIDKSVLRELICDYTGKEVVE
jgi:hypothetical protein